MTGNSVLVNLKIQLLPLTGFTVSFNLVSHIIPVVHLSLSWSMLLAWWLPAVSEHSLREADSGTNVEGLNGEKEG